MAATVPKINPLYEKLPCIVKLDIRNITVSNLLNEKKRN